MEKKTIRELLIEFFKSHPNEDMPHGPVVDWVEERYLKIYNKKPRDTWRSIRNLHESGFLIKVRKGIYRYDPEAVKERKLEESGMRQKRLVSITRLLLQVPKCYSV